MKTELQVVKDRPFFSDAFRLKGRKIKWQRTTLLNVVAYGGLLFMVLVLFHPVDAYSQTLIGPNISISVTPNHQIGPVVAVNGASGQSLVVWTWISSLGFRWGVEGQLLAGNGSLVGAKLGLLGFSISPAVAFNTAQEQFLTVALSSPFIRECPPDVGCTEAIVGRFVNTDGSLGGIFSFVACQGCSVSSTAVAYNPLADQYVIIWTEQGSASTTGQDIFAQRVNADGTLDGDKFPISSEAGNQSNPAVAFSLNANEFFVVWRDDRNLDTTGSDVFAQRVDTDGNLVGAAFPISTAAGDQSAPSLAFNSLANEFFIVWESAGDIRGQRLNAEGTLIGAEFPIFVGPSGQRNPSVSYSSQTNQFLVAWADNRVNNFDVFARVLNADGTQAGADFRITDVGSSGGGSPKVVYNIGTDQFLVVWADSRNGNFDVFGQLVALEAEPPPLLSLSPSSLDFGPVAVGSSKDLTFTVQNTGGETLNGNASTSAPFSIVGDNSFNLGADESKLITVRFSPLFQATFMDNVVFASNGGDAFPMVRGVGVLSLPDLVVSSLSGPAAAVPGSKISIDNSIRNVGFADAGSSVVRFYLSSDSEVDITDKLIGSRKLPALSTGGVSSENTSLLIPASVVPGVYYIGAVANATGSVMEVDRTNNTGTYGPITISFGSSALPPEITGLSASSGAPGAKIAIFGNRFGAVRGSVSFGLDGAQILSWGNEKIETIVPSASAGVKPVKVSNAAGTSNDIQFAIVEPRIDSLNPSSGRARNVITIKGESFGPTQGTSMVKFGDSEALVQNWANSSIKVGAPLGLTGTVPVTVTTAAGQSNSDKTFTYEQDVSSPCEGFFSFLKRDCNLVDELRDNAYLGISEDLASDEELLNYIERNREEIKLLLLQIDFGRDIDRFRRGANFLKHEKKLINQIDDAGHAEELLGGMLDVLAILGESVALRVVGQTASVLSTIFEGFKIYKQLAVLSSAVDARALMEIYLQERCGGSAPPVCSSDRPRESVWSSILQDFGPVVDLIGATRTGREMVDEWFENAFLAYRLVGYNDSEHIRHAAGAAIAQLATGIP